MYLLVFLLLLLSIYKIFFLLDCVIYACWGTLWKKFLESPLMWALQTTSWRHTPPNLVLPRNCCSLGFRPNLGFSPHNRFHKLHWSGPVYHRGSKEEFRRICYDHLGIMVSSCNRLWTEDKPFPIGDVILMVRQLIADFLKANPITSVPTPNVQRCRVRWSKPIPPLFKINFDGVVFNDLDTTSVGVVVQDSQGMVLASMSK